MFNESWEGKDLAGFIKTTLAAQIQKSKLGEFINSFGASSLLSMVSKKTSEDNALKIADGIDMGNQVPKNIIPIIYGHIGMSNTQFDNGQKPSGLDAEVVVQSVKVPISEGPIHGPGMVIDNHTIGFDAQQVTPNHLRHVILNDSYVMDPVTRVFNHKDVDFEMTLGDGGITSKKRGTIELTNTFLGTEIEAENDTTNDTLLNDLGDVTAAKGVDNVLYWNPETNRWEAKSFNQLLNDAGATYNGGAGGDGGDGGEGGEGGTGGQGGVGPSDGSGLKYTQYNPPPTHVEAPVGSKTETTITPPPSTTAFIVTGKGAPLREVTDTLPYFYSDIDFADVDETIETIDVTFNFPDGIYREVTTVTTALEGTTLTLCGTERPITGSGNLDCLTPNVSISDDGQISTTKTRTTASPIIHLVLTTVLEECGDREFILHDTTFPISHLKIGAHKETVSFPLTSMNAGVGTKADGTQQFGSLANPGFAGDCNSTDVEYYDFANYTLSDYLEAYPDQIVRAGQIIRVRAWIQDTGLISTNTYLEKISVCSPLDNFDDLYTVGESTVSAFNQYEPDYGEGCFHYESDTDVVALEVKEKRCVFEIDGGGYTTATHPDPYLVWDYSTMGQPGDLGADGVTGSTGNTGAAGSSGSVAVPNSSPIPMVTGKDTSYPGDGATVLPITLPTIEVSNAEPSSTDTLTIAVSHGTLHHIITTTGVQYTGDNSSSLELEGSAPDIQTCLDGGITFIPTTATFGDVSLTLTIVSDIDGGSSLDNKTIRSQAVTAYGSPTFEIEVTGHSAGSFLCDVDGVDIMLSVPVGAVSDEESAGDIASAISVFSSEPNWTATSSGDTVTVTGEVGLGSSYNGITPDKTGGMAVNISTIGGGISPSRKSQPVRNAGNLKAKFLPALAFTNTLTDPDVAFAQLAYRPPQSDGQTTLSEVGFFVAGRKIQNGTLGSFPTWQNAGYSAPRNWSNSPAWAFFDYYTDSRFGLGDELNDKLTQEQRDDLYYDIWLFFGWCAQDQAGDDIIDINAIIYGAESKIEVLQKIAALGHGKFVYLNGNPRLIFDGMNYSFPGYTPTVKKLVNQTNASNLTYQSGSIDNLNNVINVKYANRDNFYRLEEVQYRNTSSIADFGERETTVDLWGCSVKQQALWHGAWLYETEASNSETVTYIAGWDHFDVLPGDLICVSDSLRVDGLNTGGRVTEITGSTLTLDRIASGNIAVMDTSGVIQYGTASGTNQVSISGTFQVNAVWNIYTTLSPSYGTLDSGNYRVIAIEESEDGIYSCTAQKFDPDKYSRVWTNTI